MTVQLNIQTELDAIFRQTCEELNLTYTCVQEGIIDNRYEIGFMFYHDLYYLGISIGLKRSNEIFTK